MQRILKRVLLVDNDEAVRTLARMSLELDDLEVVECVSGAAALLAASEAKADIFFLDFNMPRMNGLETADKLRAIAGCGTVPFVLLTGSTMPRDLAEFQARGAAGVIVKPFVPTELGPRLRKIYADTLP